MPCCKFTNFPKAKVAFGDHFRSTDSEKLKEHLNEALKKGQEYVPKLKTYTLMAGKLASVMTVLVMLVGEVDKLYNEMKQLENRMFNTILEGKIRALNRNLKNMQDPNTSETQKVAELVIAFSNLDELLPVFAKEDSIFRERYYQGAPLFVRFCVILKAICLIAERTSDYNTANMQSIKQDYQAVLDWYRKKCIGGRMASCYVKPMLGVPGGKWCHDWRRHYDTYSHYYEYSPFMPWMKYGENLGGKGWRLWCGWATYCNLIDTWDTRLHEEVEFEVLEISSVSNGLPGQPGHQRDALAEYRRRVENVMLEFFNGVSLET